MVLEKGVFGMHTKTNKLSVIIGMVLLCTFVGCGSTSSASTAGSSPTLAVTQNPYSPQMVKLLLSDPLKDNSRGYEWDETTQGSTSCGFSEGGYRVKALAQGAIICNPEAKSLFLNNLTYEISLKVIQGEVEGMAFRFNQSNVTGYTFFIDTQHGTYSLNAANGTSTPFRGIINGSSTVIRKGLKQSNVLAIVANNSIISLYINNQFIAKANDSTYSQGQLGIFTADIQSPADVEASNARAWTL